MKSGMVYKNAKGERFVHISSVDRPDHGSVYEELWNLATGEQIHINRSSFEKMESLGPDMPARQLTPTDDFKFPPKSDWDVLRPHLSYFLALLEGHEPVKSWFDWLSENQSDLGQSLSRMDYLQLKGRDKGTFLLQVLGHYGQKPAKISPRYFWLLGRG